MNVSDDFVFSSGMYKGRTYGEIKKKYPGYIQWCKENAPQMFTSQAKPKSERIEPTVDQNPKGLQPNYNFWNEGPNGTKEKD